MTVIIPDGVALSTSRLELRPFEFRDVEDIVSMGGFPTWDGSGPPSPYMKRHAEKLIAQKILDSWETNPSFVIVLDGKVVGSIGMTVNQSYETAEIGYTLQREHWGNGIIPEALKAVLSWALRDLGLAKVSAQADIRNERSWKVMDKVGMTREGISRNDHVIHNVRTGMVWYSILREEFGKL